MMLYHASIMDYISMLFVRYDMNYCASIIDYEGVFSGAVYHASILDYNCFLRAELLI